MPFQITSTATLKDVVTTVCTLMSQGAPASPVASADLLHKLMITRANLAAEEMSTQFEWPDLIREGSINVQTTDPPDPGRASEKGFDLPQDFYRFVDQTQWNAAFRFPALGPVSPQGWMSYVTFPVSANFTLTWQRREGKVWFLNPPPPPGQDFVFMYVSKAFVRDQDDPGLFKNRATKDGDIFLIDDNLMTLLTHAKTLESKGFDSSAASRDFATAWDARCGATRGARVLDMAGGPASVPLIGVGNIPAGSLYGMKQ